jgi:hypothetical protein
VAARGNLLEHFKDRLGHSHWRERCRSLDSAGYEQFSMCRIRQEILKRPSPAGSILWINAYGRT